VAGFTTRDISLPPSGPSASVNRPAASDHATRDPWIFREGRKSVSGPKLVRDIHAQLERGSAGWIDALIQAGELEAALADAAHPCAAVSSELTDALAAAVCSGNRFYAADASELIARITPPEWISISPPEGFTYYALHPSDFARVMAHLPAEPKPCAIIGIRSIGTTLSAVAMASLKLSGRPASRITVRPTGHPYARQSEFDREHRQWIRERLSDGAQFAIVDEGPGRSGSTFLSVAEALIEVGVSRESITVFGSREADPESLCAENAARRWSQFRYIATSPSVSTRFKDCLYAGGGCWREFFFSDEREWPESWTQTERLKFISSDRSTLFKFEGMGRIGADARQRAFALSEAGFAPPATDAADGFLAYDLLPGSHLSSSELSSSLLGTMARYCAFRVSNFADYSRPHSQLKQMVEFNVQQEFGIHVTLAEAEFDVRNPVLVDGRMQPYEWIATAAGTFVKTDGIDHGDNHFFPGPCDIAWDLAGIGIEWQLRASDFRRLLQEFSRCSGLEVSPQMPVYLLAYAACRMSFCRMAQDSVRGSSEEPRLEAAYGRYRDEAARLLADHLRNTHGASRPAYFFG
jgi:hypothetical protein